MVNKVAYLGYDGKAKWVEQIYVGVNGKARLCKKVYVGVNGIARQAYGAIAPIPTLSGSYTYNAAEQSVTINNLVPEFVEVSGTPRATNAGTYTVTFTLKHPNIKWSDNTTDPKSETWTIAKASITVVCTDKISVMRPLEGGAGSYLNYDYVIKVKIGDSDVLQELPVNATGQYYNPSAQKWLHDNTTLYKVNQNRIWCDHTQKSSASSDIGWQNGFPAKAIIEVAEGANTLPSSLTLNGVLLYGGYGYVEMGYVGHYGFDLNI